MKLQKKNKIEIVEMKKIEIFKNADSLNRLK